MLLNADKTGGGCCDQRVFLVANACLNQCHSPFVNIFRFGSKDISQLSGMQIMDLAVDGQFLTMCQSGSRQIGQSKECPTLTNTGSIQVSILHGHRGRCPIRQ